MGRAHASGYVRMTVRSGHPDVRWGNGGQREGRGFVGLLPILPAITATVSMLVNLSFVNVCTQLFWVLLLEFDRNGLQLYGSLSHGIIEILTIKTIYERGIQHFVRKKSSHGLEMHMS